MFIKQCSANGYFYYRYCLEPISAKKLSFTFCIQFLLFHLDYSDFRTVYILILKILGFISSWQRIFLTPPQIPWDISFWRGGLGFHPPGDQFCRFLNSLFRVFDHNPPRWLGWLENGWGNWREWGYWFNLSSRHAFSPAMDGWEGRLRPCSSSVP